MPWIQANGVSLRYRLQGDGPRVLVLLHEMGGCLESWDRVVPALCARFRVLRFDARGAGLSEKRRDAFGIDDLADDLGALLAALELPMPVALAGCAVGAAVALRFAARRPGRANAVLALAPATGLAPQRREAVLALAEQFERHGVRERVTQRFDHAYPAHYFDDPAQREQVLGRLLANDPHTYAATYRMLCALDMDADLAAIACPVRVVAGRHDTTRPAQDLEQLARRIGGAEFRVIDSGHAMPILSPAAVARELLDFLAGDRVAW